MKQKLLKTYRKVCLLLLAGAPLLVGCAIGYDSPDGFDVGVRNAQLETPDSVSFVVSTDGTKATISWPLVLGAKGYEVSFLNVDDPEAPSVVGDLDKYLVDGSSVTVPVAEDSKYRLEIRVIGKQELGNKDAAEPTVFNLSTLVPSVATIPNGSDIYEYLQANPIDSVGEEVAIDLEPGGTYTLSGPIDFGGQKLTFRGDKLKRTTVNVTGTGALYTYSGLKVKYINFDMTEATAASFIFMSANNLPSSILSENLGYTRGGSPISGIYVVQDPIYIAHCWFKNMPGAILHDNAIVCAYWNFTLTDCICQLNNAKGEPFISLQKKGRMVKNLELKNSTIYDIVDNSSTYFIRYSNSSNARPEKTFGDRSSEYKSQSWTFTNMTFSKTFSGQKFINNVAANDMTLTVDHSIFYDICQTRRLVGSNRTYKFNFWYAFTKPDSNDPKQKDSSGAPFASEYDPQFKGSITQPLDLSLPNGGVDFTPQEYEIISNSGGDPRWLSGK